MLGYLLKLDEGGNDMNLVALARDRPADAQSDWLAAAAAEAGGDNVCTHDIPDRLRAPACHSMAGIRRAPSSQQQKELPQ